MNARIPDICLYNHFPGILLNREFIIVGCSRACEDLVRLPSSEMVGRRFFDVFPGHSPEQREAIRASCLLVWEHGMSHHIPFLEYFVDESKQFWSVVNTPLLDGDGGMQYVLNRPSNITEVTLLSLELIPQPPAAELDPSKAKYERYFRLDEVQKILSAERNRLEQLFKQAPSFICMLRGENHYYEMANDAYYQLVGHRQIIGCRLADVLPEVVPQGFLEKLNKVYRTGVPFIGRAVPIQLQRAAGGELEQCYIDLMYHPIRDDSGHITGIFVQGHDVTEAHFLSQKMSHQAVHDSLTGLANRRMLTQVGPALEELDGGHMLLYLDLDHFKIVNDRCGHLAGDELLIQVANILNSAVRAENILARVGGDEFVFILRHCTEFVGREIAQQLRKAIQNFIFIWDGRRYSVTLSVGMVAFGSTKNLGFSEALSLADSACFLAKEKGRNRLQEGKPDDEEVHQRRNDMDWASRIKEAIADDKIVLWAQRIVPLAGNHGAPCLEILARLLDDDGNIIPPGAFIHAAERFGVIEQLDYHVVNKAFLYLETLEPSGGEPQFFVNLSGSTLSCQDFPLNIKEISDRFPGVSPSRICFEVTETSAITNLARAAATMRALMASGFTFALDDFGSGMSSFSYLEQLPVAYVKIDGEFIKTIDSNVAGEAIVEAVTKVAKKMGIITIAEYVERLDQVPLLRKLGVDKGQGYAIHKPEPLDELLKRL